VRIFDRGKSRFEQVVRAYSAELYRYAYWLCRDRFLAEDLIQETFARAWTSWSSLNDESAVKSWLYTILRNEHARLYERKRLDIAAEVDLDSLEDRQLSNVSGGLELRDALHSLPPSYREPLLLQVLGGFSCDEIARLMNLTRGATMTRLSRARLALRRLSSTAGRKDASNELS
jgi:RNA polymerase sigma-70 factor (ECF subfamily)